MLYNDGIEDIDTLFIFQGFLLHYGMQKDLKNSGIFSAR
jgi:hypothetical protein